MKAKQENHAIAENTQEWRDIACIVFRAITATFVTASSKDACIRVWLSIDSCGRFFQLVKNDIEKLLTDSGLVQPFGAGVLHQSIL